MGDLLVILPIGIAVLLLAAAWHDLATRLIPDAIALSVGALGLIHRLGEGLTAAAISLGIACALFLVLVPVAMRGALGGGDVKLATALAMGLSPAGTWDFVFCTVMVGGLLGLAYLAGPWFVGPVRLAPAGTSILRRVLQVEYWRLRRRGPLPYAVAIATGGIFVHLLPIGG